MRVGLQRRLSTEEFMLLNCGALESPLGSKEIKPVNPKGNQSWIFIGGTDAEAEAPILSPLDVKCQLIGRDSDAGKDWHEENRTTEYEMVGWHHWSMDLSLSKLWETVGAREAWSAAAHGVTELDTTQQLKNSNRWGVETMLNEGAEEFI